VCVVCVRVLTTHVVWPVEDPGAAGHDSGPEEETDHSGTSSAWWWPASASLLQLQVSLRQTHVNMLMGGQ